MPMLDELETMSRRFLQEPQNNGTEPNAFVTLWNEKPKVVLTYFAAGVIVFLVCFCTLREFVYRKWGFECFPWYRVTPPQQRLQDEHVARELQREIDELERREVIDARRMERRLKYLAPYTMVVESEDVFYAVDHADGTREIHQLTTSNPKDDTGSNVVHDGDEESGNQMHVDAANHTSTIRCCENTTIPTGSVEDNYYAPERLLKVPCTTNGQPRYVDGSCSICLLDYDIGDAVIRSTRRSCPHAFHDECILSWLSKGKKRCPMCRHFFVPGSKVDGKKCITHDVHDLQASTGGRQFISMEDEEDDENEDETDDEPLALAPDIVGGIVLHPAHDSTGSHVDR